MTRPRFHLLGAAGYIAYKHLDAIKEVGGELVSAHDISDSVGILDRYNKMCNFTKCYQEAYERYRVGDYVVICTPNHLHHVHSLDALDRGARVICEKPVVTDAFQVSKLLEREVDIYPVLQMRHHPTAKWLEGQHGKIGRVVYSTPRGLWYGSSWKSERAKSGGLMLNIGIHLFDLLLWKFGEPTVKKVHYSDFNKAAGRIKWADDTQVDWLLTIDPRDCPTGQPVREMHFGLEHATLESPPFCLHEQTYREILAGTAPTFKDAVAGLELVYEMRS